MASINFVLRPSSKVDRAGSLTLRVIHCRQTRNVTLPDCRLYSHEWNPVTQSVIYPPTDNPERSAYLSIVELKIRNERDHINGYITELERGGHYCTDDIISLYREKSGHDKMLGYTKLLTRELEKRGQKRTARAYRTVTRGLVAFNKGVDIPLCQINAGLIKSFELYLKNKELLPNTISYYMRNLRAIYNKAVAAKYIFNPTGEKPFAGVFTGYTKTMKRALPQEELKRLHDLDFSEILKNEEADSRRHDRIEKLYFAWLLFFFCFYARGMCFIDLVYLRKENISGGVLRYCRKKTGQQVEVRITDKLQEIIDRFASQVRHSPYLFPILTENGTNLRLQYENALRLQNNRLKRLSQFARIRAISTHVSRHTWATIGKKENVPLRVISECLGHTSERTTLIYLGLLDNHVLDQANDIITSAFIHPQSMQIKTAACY